MSPKWIAIVVVVCAGAYYVHAAQESSVAEKAKLKLERAVEVLPPDTEQAWISYVERRFASVVQPKAGAISIAGTIDDATYVSRNTPYKVSCDPITGGSVEFGYGENAVTAPVYEMFSVGDSEAPPRLGVSNSSLAAAKLSKALCERIVVLMGQIVQP